MTIGGDLIGRKRAYVLGLLGYGIGALAMALALLAGKKAGRQRRRDLGA